MKEKTAGRSWYWGMVWRTASYWSMAEKTLVQQGGPLPTRSSLTCVNQGCGKVHVPGLLGVRVADELFSFLDEEMRRVVVLRDVGVNHLSHLTDLTAAQRYRGDLKTQPYNWSNCFSFAFLPIQWCS